jgi:hypothetical protein
MGGEGLRCYLERHFRVTRREVAFSWEAEDVVLELRAFMMGPNPVVSVRGTGWQPDLERFGAIEREMAAALKRLAGRLLEQPLGIPDS